MGWLDWGHDVREEREDIRRVGTALLMLLHSKSTSVFLYTLTLLL